MQHNMEEWSRSPIYPAPRWSVNWRLPLAIALDTSATLQVWWLRHVSRPEPAGAALLLRLLRARGHPCLTPGEIVVDTLLLQQCDRVAFDAIARLARKMCLSTKDRQMAARQYILVKRHGPDQMRSRAGAKESTPLSRGAFRAWASQFAPQTRGGSVSFVSPSKLFPLYMASLLASANMERQLPFWSRTARQYLFSNGIIANCSCYLRSEELHPRTGLSSKWLAAVKLSHQLKTYRHCGARQTSICRAAISALCSSSGSC
jgi:hypothetical protein